MVEQDQSGREVSDRPTSNHHWVTRETLRCFFNYSPTSLLLMRNEDFSYGGDIVTINNEYL